MNAITLRESPADTNDRQVDATQIRGDQKAITCGARPKCHTKRSSASASPKASRRKLPYEEIRRLHGAGLTGVAIAKQLGLKRSSVSRALIQMGLGSGRPREKRDVLPGGKIRCTMCCKVKPADEFNRRGSRCISCLYALTAQRSNRDLNQAVRIRNLWIRSRAKRLHIEFDLTAKQLADLYFIQCGQCEYCSKPMVMKLGTGRSDRSASVERIIPHKQGGSYTIKNVVWVHFKCNCRRKDMVGKRLKTRFPEASKAIERVARERQLELPFPADSCIDVTNDVQPQPAAA
jgi:hypothetical protein